MVTLKPATLADVSTLVSFDEMAAVASSHAIFTPDERARMRDFYSSAVASDRFEAFMIVEENVDGRELYGSLLLQHDRPAETYAEEIGSPFVFPESDAAAIPVAELHDILSGRTEGKRRTHIKAIALAPQARGKGVGRTILELVTARAKERGSSVLSFSTAVDNHAMQRLAKRATWLRVRTGKPAPALPEKLIAVMKI